MNGALAKVRCACARRRTQNRLRCFRLRRDEPGVALSPDGRWLAYSSNEIGPAGEFTMVPFHAGTGRDSIDRWRQMAGGIERGRRGLRPTWRGDGKELFFTSRSFNTLMSSQPEHHRRPFFRVLSRSFILFDLDAHPVSNYYAVTRDGQKIYMASYGPGSVSVVA